MKYPKTNELRHKVAIYDIVRETDEYGQSLSTYRVSREKVPAKMIVKSSREALSSDKLVSTYDYQFIIRFNQPVSSEQVIFYDGRYFSIHGVEDTEGTRKMKTIKCFYNEDDQGVVQ